MKINYFKFITNKRDFVPTISYLCFSVFYITWVFLTYKNIVYMDIIYIISTKVKHLYENNLQIEDFIYQPLFPAIISICFTFLNSLFFHLNTVIEVILGSVFLVILGYKYLIEINTYISTKKSKVLFALLVGYIIFGLHKWEAALTSFFSFAVFFILCICFFNYFLLVKYVDQYNINTSKNWHIILFFFSSLIVIAEAPAYYYPFILSQFLILFLVRHFKIIQINKKRWNIIFVLNGLLLIITLGITVYLSNNPTFNSSDNPAFKYYASNISIVNFLNTLVNNPLWVIKFYLIANSGPFLGEAINYLELRCLFGLAVLISYGAAIYYVIKNKDKRLLVPVGLIFYNTISYGFITITRYVFNIIEYGASSRYTAFNLAGVLGLVTILFFVFREKEGIGKNISWAFLTLILLGYLYVDIRQISLFPIQNQWF